MRTALLICDRVSVDFRADHGDYITMFRNLFRNVQLDPFLVIDGELPNISDYEVFICSGSRYSVYDNVPWIEQLIQLTRDIFVSGKKFIGVCFGHQLIAESLGGKVEKQETGFLIGIHNFKIDVIKNWMKPPVESFKVLMLCQDQIIQLPDDAEVIASSKECPIGMFTVGKNFLGIQGHPEFSKEYNRAVFESRSDRISSEKIGRAIQSLSADPSTSLLGGYLTNFMELPHS